MKIRYVAALLAATAAAAPAYAQDNNFSGLRGEVRIGWDSVGVNATLPNPDDDEDAPATLTGDADDDAIGYGAELGYDAQFGNFVLGAYAGLDFSGAGRCSEVLGDDLACADAGRNITAGVRGGVVLGDSLLVYAKGGYSNGRIRLSYDGDVEDEDSDVFELGRNRDGFHIGGGFEVALTRNLYAKADYTYTRYNRVSFVDAEDEDFFIRGRATRHQAMAGLGFRF